MEISKKLKFLELNRAMKLVQHTYGTDLVFGVFFYNDTDIAAIVIPTFEDVCVGEILISSYLQKIKIIDIRYVYHATRDGFPEIIRSLYTDLYIVNPKYEFLFNNSFKRWREDISAGINSGVPSEKLKIAITKIMRLAFNEESDVVCCIKQLTDIEKTAIEEIYNVVGYEGIFSQSKAASAAGISRAAMTNLIQKLGDSGVAEIQYLGNKGTYFRIIDPTLLNIRGLKKGK